MKLHMLAVLSIAACTAESPEEIALAAVDDAAEVELDTPVELDVAANDLGVDGTPTITLVSEPAHGAATIDDAGAVHYAPAAEYLGDDEFRYAIANPDGTTSEAAVYLRVGCATCAIGSSIVLTWTPNAPSEMVLGYRIYFGTSEPAADMMKVDDIAVGQPGFDNTAPTRAFDAWADFKLRFGETACFRLTAYNAAGESDFTNAACKVISKEMAMAFVL